MNKYNLSALSKKGRADIFNEAEKDGVIIQDCNTNGDVRREFVLITPDVLPLVNSVWDIDIMNGKG